MSSVKVRGTGDLKFHSNGSSVYTLHQAQEEYVAWPTLVITLESALARATVANHHPGAGASHLLS